MQNLPGSCKSLTSPPCVSLSSSWATRTKRRFLQIWRIGRPGPFPEEPPLSWHSKVLCLGISLVRDTKLRYYKIGILKGQSLCFSCSTIFQSSTILQLSYLCSSSRLSCLSVTGAQSLMRASLITAETRIHVALVRLLPCFYEWIAKINRIKLSRKARLISSRLFFLKAYNIFEFGTSQFYPI